MFNLDARIQAWILRRDSPQAGTIKLHRRRVYIVPTQPGFLFGMVLLAMLLASINYQLSLGYLFTFLVAAVGVVGMHRTHDVLLGLEVSCVQTLPGHAGGEVTFVLRISNPHRHLRAGLMFFVEKTLLAQEVFVEPLGQRDIPIVVRAERRGFAQCPRIRIESVFPFGLWRAWSYVWPKMNVLVYPALSAQAAPRSGRGKGAGANRAGSGQDSFSHVSAYHDGDDVKRLHWQSFAREQLALRQHEGEAGDEDLYRLDALEAHLPLEERLSQLASAIVWADQRGARFALALNEAEATRAQFATGSAHRHALLARLALVGMPLRQAEAIAGQQP